VERCGKVGGPAIPLIAVLVKVQVREPPGWPPAQSALVGLHHVPALTVSRLKNKVRPLCLKHMADWFVGQAAA